MPGIDIQSLILTVGYLGLFAIVFAETGLLAGFFLPGDTLLITAGLMVQRGQLDAWLLLPLLVAAAVAGDFVGFEIGKHAGPRLFSRDESRFFKRRHLERAKTFYDKHGGKTILIARFLAVVRTFAPTVAGAAGMHYGRFVMFNAAGAAIWVASMLTLGYVFGQRVGNLEVFFTGLVAVTVILSMAPGLWHLWRQRHSTRSRDQAAN
ncbi:MAG: VTT domain-containing protein [Dehalococcoidia bacterium]|nr:VTT domain-containing protein [Dehalococcoidia bacterium]MCB9484480.1 VTT domain-containing protein [Thermoflexaceae bacterium]